MLATALAFLWVSAVSSVEAPSLTPTRVVTAHDGDAVQCLAGSDDQVYLFTSSGRAFEILGHHQVHGIPAPPRLVELLPETPFRAAVAPDGRWLLTGSYGALIVVDGDEILEIPAPGMAQDVAWWDGEPVAHFTHGRASHYVEILAEEPEPDEAAAFHSYDNRKGKWAAHGLEDLSDSLRPGMAAYYKAGVILSGTDKGGIWIANRYHWRVWRLSAGGKGLLDIEQPEISVPMDRTSQEAAENVLIAAAISQGIDPEKMGKATITSTPGKPVVLALAGQGSTGYLLWHTPNLPPDVAFLDRIQAGQVERLRIQFPGEMEATMISSMASDRHGLMLAGIRASRGGLWRISVEALVGSEWQLVEPGAEDESEPHHPSREPSETN